MRMMNICRRAIALNNRRDGDEEKALIGDDLSLHTF